jgi:hypothetical protein
MNGTLLAARLAKRWKQVLAAGLAALLLVPLPVFAFTFVTPWSVFQNYSGPNPPPPATALAQDISSNTGLLQINMGTTGTFTRGSTTVYALRDFYISQPTETVYIGETFQAGLISSYTLSDVFVQPITPGDPTYNTAPVGFIAGNSGGVANYLGVNTAVLPQGLYGVAVVVHFTANNRFSYYTNTSPFLFSFTGM